MIKFRMLETFQVRLMLGIFRKLGQVFMQVEFLSISPSEQLFKKSIPASRPENSAFLSEEVKFKMN